MQRGTEVRSRTGEDKSIGLEEMARGAK